MPCRNIKYIHELTFIQHGFECNIRAVYFLCKSELFDLVVSQPLPNLQVHVHCTALTKYSCHFKGGGLDDSS